MNLNQKLYQVSQLAKWAGRNNDFEKNAVAAAAAAAIPWGPIILGGLGTAGLLGLLKNLFNVDVLGGRGNNFSNMLDSIRQMQELRSVNQALASPGGSTDSGGNYGYPSLASWNDSVRHNAKLLQKFQTSVARKQRANQASAY